MGTTESKTVLPPVEVCILDKYPIKLTTNQTIRLFGIFSNKRTLTWSDVLRRDSGITFRKCVDCKVELSKLYNMQSDLEEWIKHGKVCLDDCKDLARWRPNPFHHFQCNIGDLILKRHLISPELLVQGGVRFEILWERYGLTPDLMIILKYTPEQWVALGIRPEHLDHLHEEHWKAIFGILKRSDVLAAIKQ